MNYSENQKQILTDMLEIYQNDVAFLKAVNALAFALIQLTKEK